MKDFCKRLKVKLRKAMEYYDEMYSYQEMI